MIVQPIQSKKEDFSAIKQIEQRDIDGEFKTSVEVAFLELWNLIGYEAIANEAAAEYAALMRRAESANEYQSLYTASILKADELRNQLRKSVREVEAAVRLRKAYERESEKQLERAETAEAELARVRAAMSELVISASMAWAELDNNTAEELAAKLMDDIEKLKAALPAEQEPQTDGR